MFKKLIFTAVAAAVVSVPLAGTAWADKPSDPGSTDTGIGQGGMPEKLGNFVTTGVKDPAGDGSPIPPGQEFNLAKDLFKTDPVTGKNIPGVSTPDAIRDFESALWSSHQLVLPDGTLETIPSDPADWTNITPGLAIKPLTPGCNHGKSAVPGSTQCVG